MVQDNTAEPGSDHSAPFKKKPNNVMLKQKKGDQGDARRVIVRILL